jgi:hypothetical protein
MYGAVKNKGILGIKDFIAGKFEQRQAAGREKGSCPGRQLPFFKSFKLLAPF